MERFFLAVGTRFMVGVAVVKRWTFPRDKDISECVNLPSGRKIVAVVASWPLALMGKNLDFQLNWIEKPTLSQYPDWFLEYK